MHRFFLRENIALFRARLAESRDPSGRANLMRRIIEAEADLAEIEAQSAAASYRDQSALIVAAHNGLHDALVRHGAQFGTIRLFNLQRDSLDLLAQVNLPLLYLVHFAIITKNNGSADGRCIQRQAPVTIDDVEQDGNYGAHLLVARFTGYRSVESVPINGGDGHLLGTMSLLYRSLRGFAQVDAPPLAEQAQSLGPMIETLLPDRVR